MTYGPTRRAIILAFLAVVLAAPARAQVVLNFDDLTFANYQPLSATYGDGLDPNIPDIQYRTLQPDGVTLYEEHVELWDADYGGLSKVVFPSSDGAIAEITFVPAEGYGVRLVSFAMAGWPNQDRQNTVMRILDASGNVVHDFAADGPVPILGANGAISLFTPNIAVAGTLRLQWGVDWNIGLDNVVFEGLPLAAIPEPGPVTLMILGLGLLAARQWRRRARG